MSEFGELRLKVKDVLDKYNLYIDYLLNPTVEKFENILSNNKIDQDSSIENEIENLITEISLVSKEKKEEKLQGRKEKYNKLLEEQNNLLESLKIIKQTISNNTNLISAVENNFEYKMPQFNIPFVKISDLNYGSDDNPYIEVEEKLGVHLCLWNNCIEDETDDLITRQIEKLTNLVYDENGNVISFKTEPSYYGESGKFFIEFVECDDRTSNNKYFKQSFINANERNKAKVSVFMCNYFNDLSEEKNWKTNTIYIKSETEFEELDGEYTNKRKYIKTIFKEYEIINDNNIADIIKDEETGVLFVKLKLKYTGPNEKNVFEKLETSVNYDNNPLNNYVINSLSNIIELPNFDIENYTKPPVELYEEENELYIYISIDDERPVKPN